MNAIYKKEIKMFFSSMEAYIAMSVFFLINGLILWYIPSDFNIFYNQKASLLPFFTTAPWILLILIPAITMKMVSAEFYQKTNLILFTKPIKKWDIIFAKFLASLTIGKICLIPTLIFVYSIYNISDPIGNIDVGELIGSYLGIMMLISLYSSIGLFCSSISNNNMIAYILTIIIILLLYMGVNILGTAYNLYIFEFLSIQSHYESISRGVIDSRDIIYFSSIIFLFLYFSSVLIEQKNI
ncbi:MAG: gliding motility-associated ABC transporter permease subunit GldF [Flavobacteriales bacterium]|nr:gliding motility-associated ABC transporter permease subunit GldF [Flavobacteriales bacterium]|tara:strand:+ start:11686 stop:12405 length:720 start_codon:yes stop_codon:yes gene_type:complete